MYYYSEKVNVHKLYLNLNLNLNVYVEVTNTGFYTTGVCADILD